MMYKLTARFEIMVVADSPNDAIELTNKCYSLRGIILDNIEKVRIICEPCFDLRDIPKDWLDVWPYGDFDKPCSKYFEEEEET